VLKIDKLLRKDEAAKQTGKKLEHSAALAKQQQVQGQEAFAARSCSCHASLTRPEQTKDIEHDATLQGC
jgi:TATA-binding protein-associated factor Taf7